MATFQWQFDAPTGTYKQHALSKRIYNAAVENSVFMDHVQPITSSAREVYGTALPISVTRIEVVEIE